MILLLNFSAGKSNLCDHVDEEDDVVWLGINRNSKGAALMNLPKPSRCFLRAPRSKGLMMAWTNVGMVVMIITMKKI